jgi:DegV family protein with EDD domain
MAAKYDTIISIHLSSALSGTLESAKMASQQLSDINIHPIDSGTISLGLGFLILLTARLIENDCSLSQILNLIKKAKENLFLYFTVSDLKYLEQGGRIGKARAFLGSIFNINPIISLDTGTGHVLPLEKSRGKSKTRKRMVAIGLEKLQNKKFAWIGFAHGDRKKDNNKFKESLLTAVKNNLNLNLEVFTNRINATLGCHVGPSVYAGVIMTGNFLNL